MVSRSSLQSLPRADPAYERGNEQETRDIITDSLDSNRRAIDAAVGDITTLQTDLDAAEAAIDALESGAVLKADYDANTILAANADNTPLPLAVAEQRIVGRITGQNIDDLTDAQVKTMLGLSSSDSPSFAGLNGGPIAGFRNQLINGCMRVNQRAPATNADDTYAHDRWNILTQTNTVAVTTEALIESGWASAMRITQSQASAQRFGVEQIIEAQNGQWMRGSAVTLSARVRMSASTTLRYAILEWTGTADSVTSDVVNDWTSGTFTAGNFFLGSNLTVTAAGSQALTANTAATVSLSATLGTSLNNLIVLFWTDSTQAQNVTLDIGKAQLEPGSVATAFERRSISAELALCQRYYVTMGGDVNDDIASGGYNLAGGGSYFAFAYPVKMRINPTTTTVVGTWNTINCGQPTILAAGQTTFTLTTTVTASGAFLLRSVSGTAYLTFGAEL